MTFTLNRINSNSIAQIIHMETLNNRLISFNYQISSEESVFCDIPKKETWCNQSSTIIKIQEVLRDAKKKKKRKETVQVCFVIQARAFCRYTDIYICTYACVYVWPQIVETFASFISFRITLPWKKNWSFSSVNVI